MTNLITTDDIISTINKAADFLERDDVEWQKNGKFGKEDGDGNISCCGLGAVSWVIGGSVVPTDWAENDKEGSKSRTLDTVWETLSDYAKARYGVRSFPFYNDRKANSKNDVVKVMRDAATELQQQDV